MTDCAVAGVGGKIQLCKCGGAVFTRPAIGQRVETLCTRTGKLIARSPSRPGGAATPTPSP